MKNRFNDDFIGTPDAALLDTGLLYQVNFNTHYSSPLARHVVELNWSQTVLSQPLDLGARGETHRAQLERAVFAILAKRPSHLPTVHMGREGVDQFPVLLTGLIGARSVTSLAELVGRRLFSQAYRLEAPNKNWDMIVVFPPDRLFAIVKIAGRKTTGARSLAWLTDLITSGSLYKAFNAFHLSGWGKFIGDMPVVKMADDWTPVFVVVTSQTTESLTPDCFPAPNFRILPREGLQALGVKWLPERDPQDQPDEEEEPEEDEPEQAQPQPVQASKKPKASRVRRGRPRSRSRSGGEDAAS